MCKGIPLLQLWQKLVKNMHDIAIDSRRAVTIIYVTMMPD